jgi:hypothetical protein
MHVFTPAVVPFVPAKQPLRTTHAVIRPMAWQVASAYPFKKKAGAVASHYSYGGGAIGVVDIPLGLPTESLAQAVCDDTRAGIHTACMWTENKPDGFSPMYMDLDIKLPPGAPPPTDTWFAEFETRAVLEEVRKFWPARDVHDPVFRVLVLASGLRIKDDGSCKAGVHLVWQHLMVDVDMAVTLASAVTARAEAEWPEAPGVWADRVDHRVYARGKGLRWAWQFKSTPCTKCAGVAAARRTHECCVTGKVPDFTESMYYPVYYLNGDGSRTALRDCRAAPTAELLMAASIRSSASDAPTDGFVLYAGRAPPRIIKTSCGGAKVVVASGAHVTRSGVPVEVTSPEARQLLAMVRGYHTMYANTTLASVTRAAHGRYYRVEVDGPGAAYCLNMRGDHRSRHVYFYVDATGIVVQCHCGCATVRAGGVKCSEFKGEKRPLAQVARACLFPDPSSSTGAVDSMLQTLMVKRWGTGGGGATATATAAAPVPGLPPLPGVPATVSADVQNMLSRQGMAPPTSAQLSAMTAFMPIKRRKTQ